MINNPYIMLTTLAMVCALLIYGLYANAWENARLENRRHHIEPASLKVVLYKQEIDKNAAVAYLYGGSTKPYIRRVKL